MSVKELRKTRADYNWQLGNDNSRFIVETNDLFDYIKQLKELEKYYLESHSTIYNNLLQWETFHYTNLKSFLLDQESSKIQLNQHLAETALGKFEYPEWRIDELVSMTNFLKKDLSEAESELVQKYNHIAGVQKNLINCYMEHQLAKEKENINTPFTSTNTNCADKENVKEVHNPFFNGDLDSGKSLEEGKNLLKSELILNAENDALPLSMSSNLKHWEMTKEELEGVQEKQINGYNDAISSLEYNYSGYQELSGKFKSEITKDLSDCVKDCKDFELELANKFVDNVKVVNENEQYYNLEQTWIQKFDENILPTEILISKACNYAHNVADEKIIEEKDKSIMVGFTDKTVQGENINELNQENGQNESFIRSSVSAISDFFTNLGRKSDTKLENEPATIEKFLNTVIFKEKYDLDKQEQFSSAMNEEGARREVNRYFISSQGKLKQKGMYQYCYNKILRVVADFFNECLKHDDYQNAVLCFINTQEIYFYSDIQRRKMYLANDLMKHDITSMEGFWVALYVHLYRKSQHTLNSEDVKQLLSYETFFKNFEICKVKIKESQKWVDIYTKTVERLKLLKNEVNVQIVKDVKDECLNLFNNYYVCPVDNVLLENVMIEVEVQTPFNESVDVAELVEVEMVEVIEEKKEESTSVILEAKIETKEEENEFTQIKDKETVSSKCEEEDFEKKEEVVKTDKVSDEEDDQNFLEVLKTPERTKEVETVEDVYVAVSKLDVYSILIRVPKEYEMFIREQVRSGNLCELVNFLL